MYATQSLIKKSHHRRIDQPCELTIIEDQIHKFPECMRKSMKLSRHRQKVTSLKNRGKLVHDYKSTEIDRFGMNINICRALNKERELSMYQSISNKRGEEFQNTADRMYDMRKRLSPVKMPTKINPRAFHSEQSGRGKDPKNQTVFLNIQKLNLIKIYSQIQRNIDETNRGNSLESRYLEIAEDPSTILNEQSEREVIISLRKTLKEGHSMKWPTNNFKVRVKPFIPPFDRYYYKDFIWKVAFSNGYYLQSIPEEAKFKVFVGKGNNSQLVRSLIKRRSWWTFTQRWDQANLVWTQLKLNNYFNLQANCQVTSYCVREHLSQDIKNRNEQNLKIMNQNDVILWDKYWTKNRKVEEKIGEDLNKRRFFIKKPDMVTPSSKTIRMQNHFPHNYIIGNKKALLYTMTQYYESVGKKVFDFLPLSFHIKKGINDQEYSNFLKRFYERKKQAKQNGFNNVWIVKPGELTNRGYGIIVCFSLQEIKNILKRGGQHDDGTPKTFILQEYIEKPFLYQRRKFDIRHYMLATMVNGKFKGYWFKRGYIRTSSAQYTLNHSQANVHLTNDAVQKLLPDYGRYQKGNKLSYEDFQVYLQRQYGRKYNFFEDIYPQLKIMATDALKASSVNMDPLRKQHNFQLFGMDFMIDGQFKPWLIQINSNPCLELSCPLLADIIPSLVENTLKICVDSIVCPPCDFAQKRPRFTDNTLLKNQFQLVYDSTLEQPKPKPLKETNCFGFDRSQFEKDEDQEFQDDGEAYDD